MLTRAELAHIELRAELERTARAIEAAEARTLSSSGHARIDAAWRKLRSVSATLERCDKLTPGAADKLRGRLFDARDLVA